MKTGDGIIREYRIVNGRQVLVRSVCLGGGVTVGGRGMDMSRLMTEMPKRDIGLKPRSEWGKKATSPKVRKAAEKPKVVELPKVELAAEIAREVKEDERKATGDLGDALEYAASVEPKAEGMYDCSKPEELVDGSETSVEGGAVEEIGSRALPELESVVPLKPIEEVMAEKAAAVESKMEQPKVELTVTAIEPQTEQPTMAVLPELPKPGEGGKRKKRRRRRRL